MCEYEYSVRLQCSFVQMPVGRVLCAVHIMSNHKLLDLKSLCLMTVSVSAGAMHTRERESERKSLTTVCVKYAKTKRHIMSYRLNKIGFGRRTSHTTLCQMPDTNPSAHSNIIGSPLLPFTVLARISHTCLYVCLSPRTESLSSHWRVRGSDAKGESSRWRSKNNGPKQEPFGHSYGHFVEHISIFMSWAFGHECDLELSKRSTTRNEHAKSTGRLSVVRQEWF